MRWTGSDHTLMEATEIEALAVEVACEIRDDQYDGYKARIANSLRRLPSPWYRWHVSTCGACKRTKKRIQRAYATMCGSSGRLIHTRTYKKELHH